MKSNKEIKEKVWKEMSKRGHKKIPILQFDKDLVDITIQETIKQFEQKEQKLKKKCKKEYDRGFSEGYDYCMRC